MTPKIDNELVNSLRSARDAKQFVDALFPYMERRGQTNYDECVTQLEHAKQAAYLAKNQNADAAQITAALLHDIGHFLTDEADPDSDFQTEDWFHESIGAEQLKPFFDESVIAPILLHVAAKRYLCSTDESYHRGLSPASSRSLELQGGTMTPHEVEAFESHPQYESALLIRRCDDGAKMTDVDVGTLESYRSYVEECVAIDSN